MNDTTTLTSEILLQAYANGLFPMARSADDMEIEWFYPPKRGQLSIKDMHIPRSLKKAVKNAPYDVRINTDFAGVMRSCQDRSETWINASIIDAFCALHKSGYAHSVECWDQESGVLVGGLYGLAIGGAFFGESMFSRADNASKIALVHLVARLSKGGFSLLDTQFTNEHLEQFGVYEVDHEHYQKQLEQAIPLATADFILDGVSENRLVNEYLLRQ